MMNIKHIGIALAVAILLGVLIGSLIGLGGNLFKKDEPKAPAEDSKPKVETSSGLTDAEKENRDKADKAKEDATKQENGQQTGDAGSTGTDAQTNNNNTAGTDSTTAGQGTTTGQGTTGGTAGTTAGTTQTGGKQGTVTVQGASLNMRASDNPNSNVVGSVNGGTSVTILNHSNGMYQVKTADGRTAWVSDAYVNAGQ